MFGLFRNKKQISLEIDEILKQYHETCEVVAEVIYNRCGISNEKLTDEDNAIMDAPISKLYNIINSSSNYTKKKIITELFKSNLNEFNYGFCSNIIRITVTMTLQDQGKIDISRIGGNQNINI